MPVVPEPTEVIVRVQAREIHDNPTPEQLRAFLADFGEIVNELERVQLGFY